MIEEAERMRCDGWRRAGTPLHIALRPLTREGMTFDHVLNGVGDMSGMITHALDVLGAELEVDACGDDPRILHRVCQ
jgi:hypothetical protein